MTSSPPSANTNPPRVNSPEPPAPGKPKPFLKTGASTLAATSLILATTLLAASFWPLLIIAAHQRAQQFVRAGESARDNSDANLDFQLARFLDPGNSAANFHLAQNAYAKRQYQTALRLLNRAGESSTQILQLKLQIYLELNQNANALTAANHLLQSSTDPQSTILAALAYATAGQPGKIGSLTSSQTSPEALQSLNRIQMGSLPLFVELTRHSLPETAKALLMKLSDTWQRDLLLAQLYLADPTPEYTSARPLLEQAAVLNPSDAQTHQLLAQTYRHLDRTDAATRQDQLVKQLTQGTP